VRGKLILDVSVSLDGYSAGPDDDVERLHDWLYGLTAWRQRHDRTGGQSNRDAELVEEAWQSTGAIVMGRRTFDSGEEPWGDDPPFRVPCFVLTHRTRAALRKGETTFTFVTDGIESALEQARAAASDKHVGVMGANAAQQYLRAGLLDEIQLHIVPVLLGGGIRLFDQLGDEPIELERTGVIDSPRVTHLRFRVAK